jgi:hypothetical protein
MSFIQKIKYFLWWITPRIYNLPQVYYIRWIDNEYYIKK